MRCWAPLMVRFYLTCTLLPSFLATVCCFCWSSGTNMLQHASTTCVILKFYCANFRIHQCNAAVNPMAMAFTLLPPCDPHVASSQLHCPKCCAVRTVTPDWTLMSMTCLDPQPTTAPTTALTRSRRRPCRATPRALTTTCRTLRPRGPPPRRRQPPCRHASCFSSRSGVSLQSSEHSLSRLQRPQRASAAGRDGDVARATALALQANLVKTKRGVSRSTFSQMPCQPLSRRSRATARRTAAGEGRAKVPFALAKQATSTAGSCCTCDFLLELEVSTLPSGGAVHGILPLRKITHAWL